MARLGFSRPQAAHVLRLLALGVLLVLAGCVCVVQVAAGAVLTPNWHVLVQPIPKYVPPGGAGRLEIRLQNVGDAPSDGAPVTVVDHLPAGVTATAAGTLGEEEGELQIPGEWGEAGCAGVGTSTVTCTYDEAFNGEPLRPYEFDGKGFGAGGQPGAIGIDIEAEAGLEGQTLVDEASISGGGATLVASDTASITVSAAKAPFGVENVHEWFTNANGTPDTQAGSHPYEMTTSVMFNTGANEQPRGQVKDVHLELPAGLVGNINATPRCGRPEFDVHLIELFPNCPPDTQVGVANLYTEEFPVFQIPIYNLVPPAGVPAQLGFAASQKVGLIDVGVATGAGYNVTVDLHNLPETNVTGSLISIWGDPADPSHDGMRFPDFTIGNPNNTAGEQGMSLPFGEPAKPFLSLPGHCGTQGLQELRANAWQPLVELANVTPVSLFPSGAAEQPVGLEGCESLGFNPTLTIKPESTTPDTPTGLDTRVSFPQPESIGGTAESDLKEAVVRLPAGIVINPAAANGLTACPMLTGKEPAKEQLEKEGKESGINLETPEQANCPVSSKEGTVEITSPALEAGQVLKGSVYLAQQGNLPGNGSNPFGSLLALYVVAEGDGVRVKIPGEVTLDPTTGQITARFGKDPITTASTGTEQLLPQLPLGELRMSFQGGPQAALVTPTACGTYNTGAAQLTPWDGNPPTEIALGVTVSEGCGVGGFAPSFTAGTLNNQAGAYSPLTMTFSRQDGEQDFKSLEETLPPGVSAKLAGVPECGNTEAAAGSCPEASQIGTVTVAAGAGPDPYYDHGTVYLTGPYNNGPFGDVVEVPAIAGPFNLDENGKPVTIRGSIRINPTTAQATIVSDPFPTILQGIPLQVKTVNVNLSRPGFTLNATNCTPQTINATLTSTSNSSAPLSSPYEAANCATLPFNPVFTATTTGHASKANGASLAIKLTTPPGSANIAKTKVTLPLQLPSRLTTLQKACLAATFEANPASCPAASLVGTATATTPLLAHPATGPAYLVSYGGGAFPDLIFLLQDEGITIKLIGNTNIKKGITTETFNAIPDTPVTTFQATFPQSKTSILAANLPEKLKYNLCGQTLNMPTTLTAQNGATHTQTTHITTTNCPKKPRIKKSKKK
jgi:hypothetical protein